MSAVTTRSIPFNTLAPGVAALRPELDAAIGRVLASGRFLLGPQTERFEQAFAAYHGTSLQAVAVGTGTDALRIGLLALGVQPGDEVLVVANAGVPPVAAVVAAGGRPVFCDVDPSSHTLDPNEIDRRATARTRALLLVHLYGRPAAMDAILERARARGLKVIEDCAQAHGARYGGRLVGTFGDAAAFSFYPTKNLGALGDAGAVLTGDPEVAERLRLLRQYGWRQKYVSELHSTVTRVDELQAAVLTVKLAHLEEWNAARRRVAAHYRESLAGAQRILVPADDPGIHHVYHLYVIRTTARDSLRKHLDACAVGTDVHYPVPVHLQAPYAAFGGGVGSLPVTERLTGEVLSLPMYPQLSLEDVDEVAARITAGSSLA